MIRSLLLGVAATALMTAGAQAQDYYGGGGMFNFEGFYAGVIGGGYLGEHAGWNAGVLAGANFAVNDLLLLGLEFQGGALYSDDEWGWDSLALVRAGVMLNDSMLVYAAAGSGWVEGAFSYAAGGGVEYGFTDQLSARAEALATGEWGGGFDSGKATVGLIWHMN